MVTARTFPAQLSVSVNAPLTAMLEMDNCPLPEFEIVIAWAGEFRPAAMAAKVSATGDKYTVGGASPMPERAMVCDRN